MTRTAVSFMEASRVSGNVCARKAHRYGGIWTARRHLAFALRALMGFLRPRIGGRRFGRDRPGSTNAVHCFERCNLGPTAAGQIDVLPSVQQTQAADRIDRETKSVAAKRNRLCREIDAHRQRWFC